MPRVAVHIAASLQQAGVPVDVAALTVGEERAYSRRVRHYHRLPDWNSEPVKFVEALLALIRHHGYDTLMPITDTALSAIADSHEHVHPLLHLACPRPEVVRMVLDKTSTLEMAKDCGLDVPETYRFSSSDELCSVGHRLRFPVVVKPFSKRTMNPFKVRYFNSSAELTEVARRDATFWELHILQEYCSGEGVGVEVLFQAGEVVAMLQHRRLKEVPSTGGVSVIAVTEAVDPLLAGQAITLLRALKWEGVAMVEFKYDRSTQRAALMEVNGRYWGSMALSSRAGIDFPLYQWQLLHGQRPVVPASYRAGICVRWTAGDVERWHGLYIAAKSGANELPSQWRELGTLAMDFMPGIHDMLWSLRDPAPAVVELARTFRRLIWRDIKDIVPRSLLSHIRIFRRLSGRPRWSYLLAQTLRALLPRSFRLRKLPRWPRSVLFVCHGNIMRSPMAAALLEKELRSHSGGCPVSIASAGLHARTDRGADDRTILLAPQFGVSLEAHRSRPLTQEVVDQAQIIFVMDYLNEAHLRARYSRVKHKVFLLGELNKEAGTNEGEIDDPYTGTIETVRQCYGTLQTTIHYLARRLFPCNAKAVCEGLSAVGTRDNR